MTRSSAISRLALFAADPVFAGMGVICILILFSIGSNLSSPNFWFDEAGQYWIAMGQNHYSPAHSPVGSLLDVWEQSKASIADPGGFTVLVRLWSELFGTRPVTLRLLPAFFGAVFFILIFVWSRRNSLPAYVAAAISAFMLTLPNVLEKLIELRPYSMELCGVLCLGLATLAFLEKPTRTTLMIWVVADFVFLLSRYSFVVYSLAACSLLAIRYVGMKQHRLQIAVAISLSLAWTLAIYFLMLRYQTASASPPPYVEQYMIGHHLERLPAILRNNFLSLGTLGKTFFLLAVAAVSAGSKLRPHSRFTIPRQQLFLFANLVIFILMAEAISFSLSLAGKMPWDALQRWSLSETGLTALALPALFGLVRLGMGQTVGPSAGKALSMATLAVCLGMCLYALRGVMKYNRDANVIEHLIEAFSAVDCHHNHRVDILLDRGLWPNYRYLTERSGLTIPCQDNIRVQTYPADNLANFAKAGLSIGTHVTFIFGTWNEDALDKLRKLVGAKSSTEAYQFGYVNFTKVLAVSQN